MDLYEPWRRLYDAYALAIGLGCWTPQPSIDDASTQNRAPSRKKRPISCTGGYAASFCISE